MALQKQTIEIPLGVGVETKIDPKIVQPGALLALENGEFSKTGAVSKRKGYDALSKSIVSGGSVNGGARVFAAGDTLTAIASVDGVKSYYQHIKQANKWASMGNAYPGVVRTRRLARDANVSSNNIDVAVCNNYALFAWIQGSAAHHCLVDTSTNTTIWASTVSGASSGPRVTASGKYIYMVHAVGANVLLYALDTTSLPTVTAFNTPAATLQTDFSSSGTSRQVEVGSLGGGTAVLVYRTSTPSVKVQRFDQSGTIATSLAVAESAVSAIGLVVSAAGDCYVAYRQAATGDLRCFAATSAMGALFAVTTIDTDATIGVPCGVETTTANTIQWVWSITVTTATYQRVRKAQINNAGTVTSAAAVAFYGVSAASQPFVRKGRMYIMTSYNYPYYGAPIAQASQASYFLMDLGNSNATSAATAGRILPGNGSVSAGVTAGVWYVPTKVGVLSNGRVLTGAVAAYNESQFVDTIAFAMNRVELPVAVELDFDAPPRTAEINESVFVTGMAGQTIGPGTVAGQNFQLFPEIISTTGGTSGSMSDGTYQVAAVFARVDDDGTVTFSAPSIPASVALSGGGVNQSISVVVSGLKHELADFVLVYCTAASGSVFYENTRVAISACADTATATIITTNANLRILYTDGGVLENGAPPCFTSVIRKGRRLYGVTPDAKLCYTKEVVAGESPAFVEETLVKNLQQDGGETYELAEMDGAIVVLGERSIQALSGDEIGRASCSERV